MELFVQNLLSKLVNIHGIYSLHLVQWLYFLYPVKLRSLAYEGLSQCCHELFELFEYSNSWDQIVVFDIRIR